MTTLQELRKAYRKQHECMASGDVTKTTRRQRHFRPRSKTYVRLLKLWAGL